MFSWSVALAVHVVVPIRRDLILVIVIEEQLLSGFDVFARVERETVVAVDGEHFRRYVRRVGMIRESKLVPHVLRVDGPIVVQIE